MKLLLLISTTVAVIATGAKGINSSATTCAPLRCYQCAGSEPCSTEMTCPYVSDCRGGCITKEVGEGDKTGKMLEKHTTKF